MVRSCLTALALLLALPASAADLSTKDTPSIANTLPFLVQGTYVAVGVGGSLTDTKASVGSFSLADLNFSGVAADIRIGHDWKVANHMIVGLWGGVGIEGVKGSLLTVTADQQMTYDVGARVGYVVTGDAMIYVGGGWRWQHLGLSAPSFAGISTDLSGPQLVGGMEIDLSAFTGKAGLFLSNEASMTWFHDWTPSGSGLTLRETDFRDMARIGIRW